MPSLNICHQHGNLVGQTIGGLKISKFLFSVHSASIPVTIPVCLRAVGLVNISDFCNSHNVLRRARWSGLAAAKILFGLLRMASIFCFFLS